MTTLESIQKIVDNYDKLLEDQKDLYGKPSKEAIWFVTSDKSQSYEVDYEWLGVTGNGKIAWCYASGCSCWEGDWEVKVCDTNTIKTVEFHHADMSKEWQDRLIKFAENMKL